LSRPCTEPNTSDRRVWEAWCKRGEEGAKSLTDKVTDAVEEVIPGDSDRDGH